MSDDIDEKRGSEVEVEMKGLMRNEDKDEYYFEDPSDIGTYIQHLHRHTRQLTSIMWFSDST